ncbi:hypothetical protein CC80DRAFT_495537 [Byssothecium circinans]|uniref:F-box domain-containing protein n=1 Tax=Byssothecium circinans TaxID=147558 RepID=A0A6A5TJ69_9PLEO|nr:hypothetical protein CC80DRAFT_495537 [Byssothecium circinans]
MAFNFSGSRTLRSSLGSHNDSSDAEEGPSMQQNPRRSGNYRPFHTWFSTTASDPSSLNLEPATTPQRGGSPSRGHSSRRTWNLRPRRPVGSSSAITSPSRPETARRRASSGNENRPPRPPATPDADYGSNVPTALLSEYGNDLEQDSFANDDLDFHEWEGQPADYNADGDYEDSEDYPELDSSLGMAARTAFAGQCSLGSHAATALHRVRTGPLKRTRDKFENVDDKNVGKVLSSKAAVAVMAYSNRVADPQANDVWPNFRDSNKLPARYYVFDKSTDASGDTRTRRRLSKIPKTDKNIFECGETTDQNGSDRRRSRWNLPVELMEQIAAYLNRDDIKSMRLVNRELNYYVSQVIFTTVVVPFNTEIYGMLGQEQQPDLKGKKKAKAGAPSYTWKNANGDDVYNGHGLDVFKGFGRHILRYGMSFEVNEDALSEPPEKTLTERHTSFWGSFDWPFEEYRRFADVAGLETAADETPRMKTAFSELSRVKELALSIDSGLGWLNGPDRSIRARILQRPPKVFGTPKEIPDRRAQAQQELWDYIEGRHLDAEKDIKLANLYKLEAARPITELREANMTEDDQPEMPFLDPHVILSAMPQDTADFQAPTSFDDPDILNRFVSTPTSTGAGILFSSNVQPNEAGQLMSPIIPSNLTKSQKEWLLETEWAQRAFLSSYMLSIIDNSATFERVHTLNIARLSDRYIPLLNRIDFWDSLPSLENVTLMTIPSWRTVNKDEAGYVDTPKINPTAAIDPFYELLDQVVSRRSNITKLTIGWATGGEHAEGVHARNKLILPAPILTADMATNQDGLSLQHSILKFPFVESLTLKNCWITPAAVLQFSRLHDNLSMQHLVFDSVSLTAILRPFQNGHHVAANVNHAIPAFLANQWHGFQAAHQVQPHGGPQVNLAATQLIAMPQNAQAQNFFPHANHAPNIPFLQGNQAQNNVLHQGNPINGVFNQTNQGQNTIINQGQLFQNHIQALQTHIQHIQNQAGPALQPQLNALQAQLQNQIQLHNQQAQNQPANQGGPWAQQLQQNQAVHLAHLFAQANQIQQQHAAQPVAQPAPNAQTALRSEPRQGSWMNVIDIITPGSNLSDFGSEHSKADEEHSTNLQSIEFISCGYARLPYSQFDQTALDTAHGVANFTRHPTLSKRYSTLAPAMLSSKFALLATIAQDVDANELAALNAGWFLETGWKNAEEARAAEFDGCAPGGTGRFTGVVRKEDRVQAAEAS